jgi:hypothetical protein
VILKSHIVAQTHAKTGYALIQSVAILVIALQATKDMTVQLKLMSVYLIRAFMDFVQLKTEQKTIHALVIEVILV